VKITSTSSEKNLFFQISLLLMGGMYSFFFVRWRKERERMEMVKMDARLL